MYALTLSNLLGGGQLRSFLHYIQLPIQTLDESGNEGVGGESSCQSLVKHTTITTATDKHCWQKVMLLLSTQWTSLEVVGSLKKLITEAVGQESTATGSSFYWHQAKIQWGNQWGSYHGMTSEQPSDCPSWPWSVASRACGYILAQAISGEKGNVLRKDCNLWTPIIIVI